MSSNGAMSQFQTKNTSSPVADGPASGGRVYAGQSPQARQAQRRRQFLLAGLEVFGTQGFRHATVRGLCRQAQLTDRYFYQEFGSVEGLLQAVYCYCMDDIRSRLLDALQGAEAGADMQLLVDRALTVFFTALEDPRVARVCMLELEGVSSDSDTLYLGYIRLFANLLISVARTVHPHWQLNDDEAELLGTGLAGAMRQMSTSWLQGGYSLSRSTLVNNGSRIIMGLVGQLQSEAGS